MVSKSGYLLFQGSVFRFCVSFQGQKKCSTDPYHPHLRYIYPYECFMFRGNLGKQASLIGFFGFETTSVSGFGILYLGRVCSVWVKEIFQLKLQDSFGELGPRYRK